MATTPNAEQAIHWDRWTANNHFFGMTPGPPTPEQRLVARSPPGAPRRRVATRVFIQRWDDDDFPQRNRPVVRRLNFDEPREDREVELE